MEQLSYKQKFITTIIITFFATQKFNVFHGYFPYNNGNYKAINRIMILSSVLSRTVSQTAGWSCSLIQDLGVWLKSTKGQQAALLGASTVTQTSKKTPAFGQHPGGRETLADTVHHISWGKILHGDTVAETVAMIHYTCISKTKSFIKTVELNYFHFGLVWRRVLWRASAQVDCLDIQNRRVDLSLKSNSDSDNWSLGLGRSEL